MGTNHTFISLYASESVRAGGKLLYEAVMEMVKECGTGARCIVLRGIAGVDPSGRTATRKIEVLSLDLPIKIEVLVPESASSALVDHLEALAPEGVLVTSQQVVVASGKTG